PPKPRRLTAELLDGLAPTDPRAQRSRRDLRRINAWMGNVSKMAQALQKGLGAGPQHSVLELGCGDGWYLAQLSDRLGPSWKGTKGTMLDRQAATDNAAVQVLHKNGWDTKTIQRDVFEWAAAQDGEMFDAIIANLFIHHFSEPELRTLFRGIAAKTR